jgi:hypothetical protein
MARTLCLLLLIAPLLAHAARVKDGVVPAKHRAVVASLSGDYEGAWDSALISRYTLDHPVLRLALDAEGRLTANFFMDAQAAAAGEPLDLLGFGCQSRIGPLLTLAVHDPARAQGLILDATFDFAWGRCPARVHAVPRNDLRLRIATNDADGEYVASLALLRSVQADQRAYVEADGERREVKIRPKEGGRRSVYAPEVEYCLTNELGEIERCFERESELKYFLVPFPLPGLSAAWYTKKTPRLEFETGKKLIYHQGVFRRPFDG